MWERGRIELDALQISPVDWLAGWEKRMRLNDAVAFGPEGKPHAILGWDWEDAETCVAEFQASVSFEDRKAGKAVTRELRQAIPVLAKQAGASLINAYTRLDADRWLRFLGFEEDRQFKGSSRRFYREL